MRRKITTFLAVLCFVTAQAQQPGLDSLKALYDDLLPYASSGILIDRNPEWILATQSNYDPRLHEGNATDSCNPLIFKDLYRLFYHATGDRNRFSVHPDNYQDAIDSAIYGQKMDFTDFEQVINTVPQADFVLGLMHFEYDYITPMAYDSAYVVFDSTLNKFQLLTGDIAVYDTVFLDTATMSTHPDSIIIADTSYYNDPSITQGRSFHKKTLVAGSLLRDNEVCLESLSEPVKIYIDPRFFIVNNPNYTYHIDFADGNGWQQVTVGQVVNITYGSYGPKYIKFQIRNLSGNPMYEGHMMGAFIKVNHCLLGSPDGKIINPETNHCQVPMSEGKGKLVGFMKYSYGGSGKLHKPIILVEGLETSSYVQGYPEYDKGNYWGFGDLNWTSVSSGNFGSVAPQLSKLPIFGDSLLSEGYDLIYVDFHSNRSVIQKNANALISLIQAVNDSLTANGSPENIVVIGASMGGLISRTAVRKMELHDCCHNIRLHGTFSSPHRGANIPLGVQHFLYEMGTTYNIAGKGDDAKDSYDHVVNSPAARQMLIYHRESGAQPEHENFMEYLDSIGHPQHCRNIALTNGSGMGIGQRQDNNNLSSYGLQPKDLLLSVAIKLTVPVVVPDVTVVAFSLANMAFGGSTSQGNFTLMNAKAYAVDDSPTAVSNSEVFEGGVSTWDNILHLIAHVVLYATGMIVIIKILIAHGIVKAQNAISMACMLCPLIHASEILAVYITSGIYSGLLLYSQDLNQDANHHNMAKEYATVATLPYDNAPGDFNITQQTIADLSGGLVKADFPHHNFISTVSALDIDTNDLFVNVRDAIIVNPDITPFEAVWYNQTELTPELIESYNQRHVEITDEPDGGNIGWTLNMLRETEGPATKTGGALDELNTYFNYGLPYEEPVAPDGFIVSTTVQANGNLRVNADNVVGFLSSGYPAPEQRSHFSITTVSSECGGSYVKVQNGGAFTLGDNNYPSVSGKGNSTDVTFLENSVLEIENGGTLTIYDFSTLVIDEGAELIIHPGAVINLEGQNSVLEIKGKLILKSNADFAPSGSGFVRFDQNMTTGTANQLIVCEGNNEMSFLGTGKSNKRLEIASNTIFTSDLDYVQIENAKVELAVGAYLGVHPDFKSWHTLYTRLGNSWTHGGLRVYGQPLMDIRYCDFKYGDDGLLAVLSTYGNPLDLAYCTFTDCGNGLKSQGKRVNIRHSTFDNNTKGWLALDVDGTCETFKNDFQYNSTGIDFLGQQGSGLKLSHSTFYSNSNEGVNLQGTSAWSFCCNYASNGTGMAIDESEVWMNNHSQNTFDNAQDVYLQSADGLNINYGYNTFEGTFYIEGEFSSNAASSLYYDAQNDKYYLEVKNNLMPAAGTIVPVDITMDGDPVGLRDWGTPAAYPTACEDMEIETPSTIPDELETEIIIPDEGGNRILNEALIYAVGFIESQNIENADDNLTAMEILRTIMNHVKEVARYGSSEPNNIQLPLLTTQEQRVMDLAFDFYMLALSNAYRFEVLEPNRAESEQPVPMEIDYIIDEAEFRLEYQAPDASDPYLMEFHYNLAQSHAFRIGEYYDYALNKLIDAQQWAEGRELEIAEYWQCVYEAEADLILENIDAEQFLDMTMNCRLTAPAYKKSPSPHGSTGVDVGDIIYSEGDDKGEITLTLQPNPTRSLSTLSIQGSHPEMNIRVYSNTGALVHRGMIEENQKEYLLNLDVKPGVYHVHISYRGKNEVIKWIIAK